MQGSTEEILQYYLRGGIISIELMGDVAEKYAGLPQVLSKPGLCTHTRLILVKIIQNRYLSKT